MKHFGLFSLFFGFWLLAGCTADPGAEPGPSGENPPAAENPHAVPVEQALEELQSVLEEIDIPAEDGAVTRSGGIRRVKSVTTVSPEALSPGGTRSEATTNVEDLLYIVNFEDDAGYAILGADDRLESVYAIIDEGSLTAEEFRYAVTVTDEQAQADGKFVFPLQLVAQAALGGIGTGAGGNGIGGGPITDIGHLGPTWLGTTYSDWETQELQPTLVSTAWNQDAPYNYICPPTQEGNCVAGCVPIAVAQILVHNAVEYNKKFYQMGRKPIKKIYGLRSKML